MQKLFLAANNISIYELWMFQSSAAIAQGNALVSGKRRPAAIKLKRVALETGYETTGPGGYRCAKVRAYTRV